MRKRCRHLAKDLIFDDGRWDLRRRGGGRGGGDDDSRIVWEPYIDELLEVVEKKKKIKTKLAENQ